MKLHTAKAESTGGRLAEAAVARIHRANLLFLRGQAPHLSRAALRRDFWRAQTRAMRFAHALVRRREKAASTCASRDRAWKNDLVRVARRAFERTALDSLRETA